MLALERQHRILTGGFLHERSLSRLDPLNDQALECYHVQKAFLSCSEADLLVTDRSPADDLTAAIKGVGVKLLVAFEKNL